MLLHWLRKIAWTLTRYKIVYVQFHNRRKAYIIKRYILGFIPFMPETFRDGYGERHIFTIGTRNEAEKYLMNLECKITASLIPREIPEDNE